MYVLVLHPPERKLYFSHVRKEQRAGQKLTRRYKESEHGAFDFWRANLLWSHWLEGEAKILTDLALCLTSFHFFLFLFSLFSLFFFSLSNQTECWSAENMMLSHFSCRVFKLGLWERVWYNSMTEVIPLSIWALNGPLKYSLVRKNFSKWCFLIFFLLLLFLSQQITAWIWKCSSITFGCLSGQAFSQC